MTTELVLLVAVAVVVALLIVIGVRINRARRSIEASNRRMRETLGHTEEPAPSTRHVFAANAFEFALQLVTAVAAGAAGVVVGTLTDSLPMAVSLTAMALTVYVAANGLWLLVDRAAAGIRERLHQAAGCWCQETTTRIPVDEV